MSQFSLISGGRLRWAALASIGLRFSCASAMLGTPRFKKKSTPTIGRRNMTIFFFSADAMSKQRRGSRYRGWNTVDVALRNGFHCDTSEYEVSLTGGVLSVHGVETQSGPAKGHALLSCDAQWTVSHSTIV